MFSQFVIEKLTAHHDRASFCCGNDALDTYLKKYARQDALKRVSSPFILLIPQYEQRIIGYYTLASTSLDLSDLSDDLRKKLPKYPQAPAILLGRLAIDKQFQKQKWGEMLLLDALKRSFDSEIAFIAVVVEAKDSSAARFYKTYGFLEFRDSPHKLFLPATHIKKLFEIA